MTNFNKDYISLLLTSNVGVCYETVPTGQTINMLSHKPQNNISDDELAERRNYIITSLKLDQNTETIDLVTREKLIHFFLELWDVVAIDEAGYGHTDLHTQMTDTLALSLWRAILSMRILCMKKVSLLQVVLVRMFFSLYRFPTMSRRLSLLRMRSALLLLL